MANIKMNRRRLIQSAAVAPMLGAVAERVAKAAAPNIYAELGVRTLINARGVATYYTGTLMDPVVFKTMEGAAAGYVEIVELQRAVGARLAKFVGAEAAMVSSGSAACIAQATAGCITGLDDEKISRLPETDGMRNEIIITHRSAWDRSIALTGAKLVVVRSLKELEAAINEKTAMMEYEYGDTGPVPLQEAIVICKRRNVPFMLDAAPMCPPFERLRYVADLGPDLFCVSGGKGLFGPQCAGILFGRKPLIEAALRNGSPYEGAICRPMKVGKEEILGVLAAVQWSAKRDYRADCREWEARIQFIARQLASVAGIETEMYYRQIGNEVPHLAIRWNQEKLGISRQVVVDRLRKGEPQIEVIGGPIVEMVRAGEVAPVLIPSFGEPDRLISIVSNTLRPGEEKIVARRLKEIFTRGGKS